MYLIWTFHSQVHQNLTALQCPLSTVICLGSHALLSMPPFVKLVSICYERRRGARDGVGSTNRMCVSVFTR